MSEIPDDVASRVAAFLECPAGHPEDCTGCSATAKRILTALRADPELAAKALGWEVAHEHDTLYAGLGDLTGKRHVRTLIRGPWQVTE